MDQPHAERVPAARVLPPVRVLDEPPVVQHVEELADRGLAHLPPVRGPPHAHPQLAPPKLDHAATHRDLSRLLARAHLEVQIRARPFRLLPQRILAERAGHVEQPRASHHSTAAPASASIGSGYWSAPHSGQAPSTNSTKQLTHTFSGPGTVSSSSSISTFDGGSGGAAAAARASSRSSSSGVMNGPGDQ